jgi:hypothetical protein
MSADLPANLFDLILPLPMDGYPSATAQFMPLRFPLNPLPPLDSASLSTAAQMRGSGLPRPWITLVIGGNTNRARLKPRHARKIVAEANARARRLGGSLFVTTSPRTDQDVVDAVRTTAQPPGQFYAFSNQANTLNPYALYLRLADEIIVTGDSASMIAECWRSGHPTWVALLPVSLRRRLARMAAAATRWAFQSSASPSAGDIDVWIRAIAGQGDIGVLGSSNPTRAYAAVADDDLERVAPRIQRLLDADR